MAIGAPRSPDRDNNDLVTELGVGVGYELAAEIRKAEGQGDQDRPKRSVVWDRWEWAG